MRILLLFVSKFACFERLLEYVCVCLVYVGVFKWVARVFNAAAVSVDVGLKPPSRMNNKTL